MQHLLIGTGFLSDQIRERDGEDEAYKSLGPESGKIGLLEH